MALGGGQKTVTTTNQTNEAFGIAKPLYQSTVNKAQNLLDQNAGGDYYDQSLVVPYDQKTLQGLGGMENYADAYGGDLTKPFEQYNQIIDNGGYNSHQSDSMSRMNAFASGTGYNTDTEAAANTLYGLNSQMSTQGGLSNYQQDTANQLQGVAAGNDVNNRSVGFDRVLQNATDSQRDAVNMEAAKMGRYGSTVHQGTLSDSIGDLTANMENNEYRHQTGRMDAARAAMAGLGQQGVDNQQGVAGNLARIGQTAYDNVSGANTNMFEAGQIGMGNVQNAAGQMPGAYAAGQQPYRDYMNIGAMNEDLVGREMQDDLRLFNDNQNSQWAPLEKANAIASMAGSIGADTSTQVAIPSASPWSSAIGAAAQGYQDNAFGSPWASALATGGLNLASGLFD